MIRNVRVVGLAMAFLAVGSILAAQETKAESTYQLKYKFKEGQKWLDVVTLNQLSSCNDESLGAMANMLKIDTSREFTYLNEVKQVDKDGTAQMEVTVKRIKLKTEQGGMKLIEYDSDKDKGKEKSTVPMIQQMVAEIDKSVGEKFKVWINASGKVLDTKAEGVANSELAQVPRINLPKEPLKKGDKWEYESALSQINPFMSSVKIKCVLDSVENNTAVVKSEIIITGKSEGQFTGSDATGSGTFYFDAKDGKPSKVILTVTYENTVSLPMPPNEVKMNNKAGLSVESKPADAMKEAMPQEKKKEKEEF